MAGARPAMRSKLTMTRTGRLLTDGATGVLTSRGEPSQSEGNGVPGSPAGRSAETFVIIALPMPGHTGKLFRIDAEGNLTEIK